MASNAECHASKSPVDLLKGNTQDSKKDTTVASLSHELNNVVQDTVKTTKESSLDLEHQYSWLEKCQCQSLSPRVRAYKNVVGSGISFMFISSAVLALASLQSSLNDEQGLGLATLATAAFLFVLSGLFTTSFIKLFGTKYTGIIACFMSLIFVLSNFYPQWYTLIVGAIFYGLSLGPFFSAFNVHVTTIAIKYAPDLNEKTDHLIALFTGIFTMFYKFSYIPGNLATTIILFSERHSSDNDIIDTSLGSVCNNTEVDTLNTTYVYILLSCFVLMVFCGITIAALTLDHLGSQINSLSRSNCFKLFVREPFVETLKMFTSWKMYMIVPMMLTASFITSSTIGGIAKYYVSDCIGFQWVGLYSMTYGASSALAAVVTGRLVKWLPQFIMVYFFSALMLGCVLFLLFWAREPSYIVAFVPTVFIGLCEGTWNAVPPTLVGILFPDKKEPAYSVLRMGFAIGFLIGFAAPLLFEAKISLWIEIVFIIISLITYSIVVFITQTKEQIFPCFYLKN